MSQPNRRAECENVRDLFFLKQWNWGGLPAATSTALGLPCTACSNLSSPGTATFPAARSVPAGQGQQPRLGIPRCNILPTSFCLHVHWMCRPRTRNLRFLRIRHNNTGNPRENTTIFQVKKKVGDATALTSLQSTRVLLQAQVNPTCLKTTSAHTHTGKHMEWIRLAQKVHRGGTSVLQPNEPSAPGRNTEHHSGHPRAILVNFLLGLHSSDTPTPTACLSCDYFYDYNQEAGKTVWQQIHLSPFLDLSH